MILRFLLAALVLRPASAEPIRAQLEALATRLDFGSTYDGGRAGRSSAVAAASKGSARLVGALRDQQALREAKSLLGDTDRVDRPFLFRPDGAPAESAPGAGLEGFLYAERQLESRLGRQPLVRHLQDYGNYLDALLSGVSWTGEGRRRVREIQQGSGTPLEKYGRLMDFVAQYTEELRAAVAAADGAGWVRTARIYEIFPRAYNLAGRRAAGDSIRKLDEKKFFADFGDSDLASIRKMGFDTIWVMGIFPIGKRGQTGTGGGSPYSIQDFESVHPDLGTVAEFKALIQRAHRAGLRVVTDFVINHTSLDSKLLNEDPTYFVSQPAGQGAQPRGTFEVVDKTGKRLWVNHGGFEVMGGVDFWIDTAQIDYSNPKLRRRIIGILDNWAGDWGIDGFRVDMAYLVLRDRFNWTWHREMPKREFLEEMITEVKGKHPGTAFIAEGYDGWDGLSRAGFDLVYSKNNMNRGGGHWGWYDALKSRDSGWIRAAMKREGYLEWQRGGSGGVSFTGNHDEDSPRRAFGPWMEGSTFMTLLKPGSLLFYGSAEIGFDRPTPTEGKPLPFSVPVQIDWSRPDPEIKRFHQESFRLAVEIHGALGPTDLKALTGDTPWVGYLLVPRKPGALKAAAVIANPTGGDVEVSFEDPSLGVRYNGRLPAYGYRLVRF